MYGPQLHGPFLPILQIAVDEKIEYAQVKGATGKLFWIAKDLVESVFKKDYQSIEKTVLGIELVGLKYTGPFDHLPAVAGVKEKHANFSYHCCHRQADNANHHHRRHGACAHRSECRN